MTSHPPVLHLLSSLHLTHPRAISLPKPPLSPRVKSAKAPQHPQLICIPSLPPENTTWNGPGPWFGADPTGISSERHNPGASAAPKTHSRLSKAKLPPQSGKQPPKFIKIGLVPAGMEPIPLQFIRLIADSRARTQSAAGVAPARSKAESAFLKANKQERSFGKGSGQACPRGGRRGLAMGVEVPEAG